MHLILRWLLSAAALYLTILLGQALHLRFYVAPGLAGAEGVLLFVLVLGVANAVLRPILKALDSTADMPHAGTVRVRGQRLLVLAGGAVRPGVHVAGWQAPLFGSVVMGIVGGLLNNLLVSRQGAKTLMQLVVITGLSGAGKATAAKVFEDMVLHRRGQPAADFTA